MPMSPTHGFHFGSAYVSAPSSPKPFSDVPSDYFYRHASAPTSPTRAAAIYAHFSNATDHEKPSDETDFSFSFSGPLEKGGLTPALSTANELFEDGRIRPLHPPPRLHDPPSPKSRRPMGFWSPRHDGGGKGERSSPLPAETEKASRERARERAPSASSSRSRSRSLSPLRGEGPPNSSLSSSTTNSYTKGSGSGSGSKRWRLRDLLLFRNASEGRATGRGSKDPLRKYTILQSSPSSLNKRPGTESASFRSTGSNRGSKAGAPAVSAHEIHYTANRTASEEQKKKTPLPYHRHGLFGYLRFNPAIYSITRGFNSSLFGRGRP